MLTLWDDLEAPEVTPEVMADAIMLAQYYLGEAKRLAEMAVVSAEIEQAELLRCWILDIWPVRAAAIGRDAQTILPSDVVQHGPGCMRETKTVKKYLEILADSGWLVVLDPDAEVDGSPRKLAYRIVRA